MVANDKITKFLNSPMLSTSLFLASGLSNTYRDYKNADEKFKKNFLIKDTVVLCGAMAGMAVSGNLHLITKNLGPVKNAVEKISSKLKDAIIKDKAPQKAFDNKYVQSTLNFAKEIVNNTLLNCSLFVCGILGAVTADTILSKLNFEQPEKTFHHDKNEIDKFVDSQLNKYVGKENKKILYARFYDMPQLNVFAPSVIGEEALRISRENDMKRKLKRTTGSLINNSLIPMFLLSTSTIITHKMNTWLRIPTIFLSLVVGTKGINYIRRKYLDKMDKKAVSDNFQSSSK